jgi:D-alanine-D-alanine ligase
MSALPPITVLKGGISSEREVSLRSGAAVAAALRSIGAQVEELDVTAPDFPLPPRERFLFIGLHGTYGEDGQLQARLEAEGRRYSGSGPESCRLAFDKLLARERFIRAGVRVARGGAWTGATSWPLPHVLKPVADGSSVGVSLVRTAAEEPTARQAALASGKRMMVEDLIEGRELTVGILDGEALPVVEMRPKEGFYDYENKYTPGKTEHLCPAPLPAEALRAVQDAAVKAYRALEAQVYGRVDVILPADGSPPVVLELNSLPGMTDLSLLPEAAGVAGIVFPELCARIVRLSLEARP